MIPEIGSFIRDESGATAVEYGLIAALVSVAGIAALAAMGNALATLFTSVAGTLANVVSGRRPAPSETNPQRTTAPQ